MALGADDPLIFGSRLADQYATARVEHGFSDAELAALARGSLAASRAPSDVRAAAERDIEALAGGRASAGERLRTLRPAGARRAGRRLQVPRGVRMPPR